MRANPQHSIPEAIRRIADSKDRRLAWYFFILFSRFEYALKRDPRYLKEGTGDAQPDWERFASDHNTAFFDASNPELAAAVDYFKTSPPRKQRRSNGKMFWSDPIHYDEELPLPWLLRVIRIVRNNLFHGGKFPQLAISDPSRDRDLITHAIIVLNRCLTLDPSVENTFNEGINE